MLSYIPVLDSQILPCHCDVPRSCACSSSTCKFNQVLTLRYDFGPVQGPFTSVCDAAAKSLSNQNVWILSCTVTPGISVNASVKFIWHLEMALQPIRSNTAVTSQWSHRWIAVAGLTSLTSPHNISVLIVQYYIFVQYNCKAGITRNVKYNYDCFQNSKRK